MRVTDATDRAGRATARLELALDAYKLGYFLVDTVEIDTRGSGYLAAELLVSRTTPDALVTRGAVDDGWCHALADRHRLVIHTGGRPDSSSSPEDRPPIADQDPPPPVPGRLRPEGYRSPPSRWP
jgi:hypothetical protein